MNHVTMLTNGTVLTDEQQIKKTKLHVWKVASAMGGVFGTVSLASTTVRVCRRMRSAHKEAIDERGGASCCVLLAVAQSLCAFVHVKALDG